MSIFVNFVLGIELLHCICLNTSQSFSEGKIFEIVFLLLSFTSFKAFPH